MPRTSNMHDVIHYIRNINIQCAYVQIIIRIVCGCSDTAPNMRCPLDLLIVARVRSGRRDTEQTGNYVKQKREAQISGYSRKHRDTNGILPVVLHICFEVTCRGTRDLRNVICCRDRQDN